MCQHQTYFHTSQGQGLLYVLDVDSCLCRFLLLFEVFQEKAQQPPYDTISVRMTHVRQQRHYNAAGGLDFQDLMNMQIADPTITNRIRLEPAVKSANFHNGRRSSDSHTTTFGIKMFCKPLCLEMRAHGVTELCADHPIADEFCSRSQDHRFTPEHYVASERGFSNLLLHSSSSTQLSPRRVIYTLS